MLCYTVGSEYTAALLVCPLAVLYVGYTLAGACKRHACTALLVAVHWCVLRGTSLRGLYAVGAAFFPLYLKNSCNRGKTTHTYIAMSTMAIRVMTMEGCTRER